MFQVRIRESNFHSSLIQGAQNFNELVTSNVDKVDTDKTEKKRKKQKAPTQQRSESDSKMPVEQLTSHVLSQGHQIKAVNALLLTLLITIIGNRQ